MKKLNIPETDDLNILDMMRNNRRISSQGQIDQEYDVIRQQYLHYNHHNGNPWLCESKVSDLLKKKLKAHYLNPYSELGYIKQMRENGSPDVCPLCGSYKTGTLDHFLPQSNYGDWAIYSNNLVPACDCNSKRRNDVKGVNQHQRILHPYFDDSLEKRLVKAVFSGSFEAPEILLVPTTNTGLNEETIRFHIDTVVTRSSALSWMRRRWESMRKQPRTVISALPRDTRAISQHELEGFIQDTLSDRDEEYGTKNSWYSMLIFGIYSSEAAKTWLLRRYNELARGVDPLD